MFFNHVHKKLSAYCHGELAAEESRRVAEHLIGCKRCRAELEQIKLGIKLAERLPQLSAPESLWSDLQAAIDRGSLNVTRPTQTRSYLTYLLNPRLAAVAASFLLLLGFAGLWLYWRESRPFWEVASLDGAPRIGSSRIKAKGRLGVGQWLETDGESRAKIDVSSIGQVEIDPNTRVRLLETKPTEHRLELARGRMSAHIWAPPRLFFVDTPSAVATDLGCSYTLEVDDQGGSLLRVTYGWVALQLKDRESMVPAGAACVTRRGIGPGTPYFEDASANFRLALSKLDFERNDSNGTTKTNLELLLSEARPRDTLTLWHLLSRVEGEDRERVYERMVVLVPPPENVTREGIMNLNEEMLQLWKDKLETAWNDESLSGARKAWNRVWTKGLGKIKGLEGKK